MDFGVADAVLDWVDGLGMRLFDWQRDVLRDGLAMRGGKWAAYEVDLVVPRQNGKNEILVALELAAVAVLQKRLVVHSAHDAMTAQKHFTRFQELADRLPEVERLLPATKSRGFFTSNGKEHIEFRNGAVIDFRTRTRSAGRGFSSDLVVLDEAFQLPAKAVGSLMYTLRARRNPQVWKTSSAAHAGSLVLHADRRRALDSDDRDDSRFMFVEWGNEPDCDPGSEETWLRSNPSVGLEAPEFELAVQTFRNEWASARHDPELRAEFVREVCGVPDPPEGSGATVVDIGVWEGLAESGSRIESNHTWALSVSADLDHATVAVAGRRSDGLTHVEYMIRRPGTDWVIREVVEVWGRTGRPIRIRKNGSEATFIDELAERGVEVVEVSNADVSRATSRLIVAVRNGTVRHPGQLTLRNALAGASLLPSQDGSQVWSMRRSSGPIDALMAVTVALGGVPDVVRSAPVFAV